MLHRLKYSGALALAEWAASAWGGRWLHGAPGPDLRALDVLTSIPLSITRQRERGFNHAHEIARQLGGLTRLPVLPLLERVREGAAQASLPWAARVVNMRGAFACRSRIAHAHVALLDDVMTTGATLASATEALHAGGAASVQVWVVARTLPPIEA